jgi:hypothetical protein
MLAVGVGAGIFLFTVSRRLELLIVVGGLVLLVILLSAWNLVRKNREVGRYFKQLPDTTIDRGNLPVGELVKITGVRFLSCFFVVSLLFIQCVY